MYPKAKMDTQNNGLEKADSFEIWTFLVSILDYYSQTANNQY